MGAQLVAQKLTFSSLPKNDEMAVTLAKLMQWSSACLGIGGRAMLSARNVILYFGYYEINHCEPVLSLYMVSEVGSEEKGLLPFIWTAI